MRLAVLALGIVVAVLAACDERAPAADASPLAILPYSCANGCPAGADCQDGECVAPADACDQACRTCDEDAPCTALGACYRGAAGAEKSPGICVLAVPEACAAVAPPTCAEGTCAMCAFRQWTCVQPSLTLGFTCAP